MSQAEADIRAAGQPEATTQPKPQAVGKHPRYLHRGTGSQASSTPFLRKQPLTRERDPKPGDPVLSNYLQTPGNNITCGIVLLIQEENLLHKETTPVYHTGFPDGLCNTCLVR